MITVPIPFVIFISLGFIVLAVYEIREALLNIRKLKNRKRGH